MEVFFLSSKTVLKMQNFRSLQKPVLLLRIAHESRVCTLQRHSTQWINSVHSVKSQCSSQRTTTCSVLRAITMFFQQWGRISVPWVDGKFSGQLGKIQCKCAIQCDEIAPEARRSWTFCDLEASKFLWKSSFWPCFLFRILRYFRKNRLKPLNP